MKSSNTLFWVLAVIAVYVFIVFPKAVRTGSGGSFGGGGEAVRGKDKEEKPTVEELDKKSFRAGYTT